MTLTRSAFGARTGSRLVRRPASNVASWAPNADRVSVIGDFNGWTGALHAMRLLRRPGLGDLHPGSGRRREVQIRDSHPRSALLQKSDPFGFAFEVPPHSASVVRDISGYEWATTSGSRREESASVARSPDGVYEVHLGSWARVPEEGNRFLTYRELAHRLVPYVKETGFTHIELMPVMEHPFSVLGYQVLGFFAPTSRFGPPEDFKYFVDACHRAGSASSSTGCPDIFRRTPRPRAVRRHGALRARGPAAGEHQDWGTLIFNYAATR